MLGAKQDYSVEMMCKTIVIGLGKTGLSCAHFLQSKGESFSVMDNRENPPCLTQFKADFPDVPVHLGEFDQDVLHNVDRIILSPGVALREPVIAEAISRGASVLGDIELFAQNANAPIIAITGSNGKSTVTTLLGEMATQAGMNVKLGGNIGTPALELLNEQLKDNEKQDFYILELSSFQLETTFSLNAFTSVILNISPDHMDRYEDLDAYSESKCRIFNGNGTIISNRDDELVMDLVSKVTGKVTAKVTGKVNGTNSKRRVVSFGLSEPLAGEFGVSRVNDREYLAYGKHKVMPVDEMRIAGRHNCVNALAAMALAHTMDISESDTLAALQNFTGLKHRTQWVASIEGVNWYNDSKGTNVGATVAAIKGLPGSKILIAGGVGKGADFSALREAVIAGEVRAAILFGRDAGLIREKLIEVLPVEQVQDLTTAVQQAHKLAQSGDSVLFSPACASFDMFNNFEERGEAFIAAVKGLTK